jgi:hypothetical protein
MKRGDDGPKVQRLQLALLEHGYKLPRFGADGDFGGETARALVELADDANVSWSSTTDVPEVMLDHIGIGEIDDESAVITLDGHGMPDLEGVRLYDLRSEQSARHPKGKADRHGRTLQRDPSAIKGITIHQMDCLLGPKKGWEKQYSIREEAVARRALDVACHVAALRSGAVVIPANPLDYLQQANALNPRTLGLEIEGIYPGLMGGRIGHPGPKRSPTEVTVEIVHASRMGMKLLVSLGKSVGAVIEFVWAHRQADSWKLADPGEELWRKVVLEYAVPVLGLRTRPGDNFAHYKGPVRHGKPVCLEWDPKGVGRYR